MFIADEDTAEDYYAEDKPQSSGKKKRGRKPKNVEPEPEPEPEVAEEEDVNEEEYADEKPKRRRATKKSKKALDAMDGELRMKLRHVFKFLCCSVSAANRFHL